MIGILLIPLILIVEIIVFKKLVKVILNTFFVNKNIIVVVFATILFSGLVSMIIGFLIPYGANNIINILKRSLTSIGFYWLGIMLYFLIYLFVLVVLGMIVKTIRKDKYNEPFAETVITFALIALTCITSLYGVCHGHKLHIENYEISVDKKAEVEDIDIALIADIHLGYNITPKQVQNMVDEINKLDSDIVIIAGDIFDNEFLAIKDPDVINDILKGIKSKYGVYATFGNHDINEKIFLGFTFSYLNSENVVQASNDMIEFLKDANINILYDDYIEIDGIQIYGRPDKDKPNLGNNTRLSAQEVMSKLDISKPTIVVDHEPADSEQFSKLGLDVYLNGHTHAGQVWPGTLTINLFWDNPYGYKKYGNLHNIVTSGVGLFGPNMRIDSNAEICNIKINFNNYQ